MRPRFARTAIAVAFAVGCLPALAAPCAGFDDVQDTASFCSAVEWLKNRSITLGCATGSYCPGDAVTRASMALFLNRLGTALTPQVAFVEAESVVLVDLDTQPALCPTNSIASAPHPRQALVSIAFGGQAAGDLGYSARPMVSTNHGASWVSLNAISINDSVSGAAWASTATSGVYQIPAAQAVRFAVGLQRVSGTADFIQARCHLTANVVNANGIGSPFDGAH